MDAPQLTPEQEAELEAERERQAMVGLEGQTKEFRDAVRQALNTVNLEIVANDGQPQVDAAVAALTAVIAEFVAMAPSRTARRFQMAAIEKNLHRFVALRSVSGGTA